MFYKTNNIWDLLRLEELFESANIAYRYSLMVLQLMFNLIGSYFFNCL